MRLRGLSSVMLIILLFALCPSKLAAADFEWRGFFSTGLSLTDADNNYQGLSKKPSYTQGTVLGLNLSKELSKEWRVAAQFLAAADKADSALKLDWAFVTYEPYEALEIIIGKQKVPLWMTSSYLDVGRLYPWIHPPEEVYGLFFLRFFTGASIAYSLPLGSTTLWMKPYAGDVLLETNPNAPTAGTKFTGKNMGGASLEWHWRNFMLRAGYNKALWDLNFDLAVRLGERRLEIFTAGAKGEFSGFMFMTEYAETRDLDQGKFFQLSHTLQKRAEEALIAGQIETAQTLAIQSFLYKLRVGGSKAYYLTLGQQIKDFLLHLTFADLNKNTAPGLSDDQKSLALGLNYDIDTESVIKLEAKKVMIPDHSRGLFTSDTALSFDEAMIYKIGYSLVF